MTSVAWISASRAGVKVSRYRASPLPGTLSIEESAGAIEDAKERLGLWKTRALYATAAFFLSCASVVPFLYGHPLHSHWDSFGKYLVLLSMALLIPFAVSVGIAIDSWFFLRSVKKIQP